MFTYEIYPLFHVASFCEEVLSSSDEEHLCTEKLRFNLIISQYLLAFSGRQRPNLPAKKSKQCNSTIKLEELRVQGNETYSER